MVLPVRKSPRAKWHNYNGADYFVTICTGGRVNYFGSIVDGKTQLTAVGEYTKKCIEKIGVINKNVQVPLYVIMPNHIHLIIIINDNNAEPTPSVGLSYYGSRNNADTRLPHCDSPTTHCDSPTTHCDSPTQKEINLEMQQRAKCCGRLSHIIGQFKSAVVRYTKQNDISFEWQARYHDHIVRNQEEMNNIANYIEQNPAKWETDCFYGNE
jgi:REP element-mobilizing transposase RayT